MFIETPEGEYVDVYCFPVAEHLDLVYCGGSIGLTHDTVLNVEGVIIKFPTMTKLGELTQQQFENLLTLFDDSYKKELYG